MTDHLAKLDTERSNTIKSVGSSSTSPLLPRTAQSQARQQLFSRVYNNLKIELKIYTYNLFKKELGTRDVISKAVCAQAAADLEGRINSLGWDPKN